MLEAIQIVDIVFQVEVVDFCSKTCRKIRSIEMRDIGNTTFGFLKCFPGIFHGFSQGSNSANSSDHNAAIHSFELL